MGVEGAVNIIFQDRIAEAADPDAERARLVGEYEAEFANPYVAAARGYVDDVILPSETRPRLIAALEMLAGQARHRTPGRSTATSRSEVVEPATVFAQRRAISRSRRLDR